MAGVGLRNLVKYLLSIFRVAVHLPHSTDNLQRQKTKYKGLNYNQVYNSLVKVEIALTLIWRSAVPQPSTRWQKKV